MKVKNEEIFGVTQLRRELPGLLHELESGKREKIVVMKNGKMKCVMIPLPTYVEMHDA